MIGQTHPIAGQTLVWWWTLTLKLIDYDEKLYSDMILKLINS